MGYIRTTAFEFLDVVATLDRYSPRWIWANEQHQSKLAIEKIKAINASCNFEMEIWPIFPDRREALMARLVIDFKEFGPGIWNDHRVSWMANGSVYDYHDSSTYTWVKPGYSISCPIS